MNKTVVVVTAIFAVSILEGIALRMGHNGSLLATSFALIGGLAGGGVGYVTGLYKETPAAKEDDKR